MKLSDYVVNKIKESTGTDTVFLLTGGMAMHLDESFGNSFKVIPCHHEQAAGIAASCYARIKETPGVVCVTAGPGALNAVTPCGGAYLESVPMIFISGQVSMANSRQGHPVRQRGIQEIEIVDVVKSITKYAVKIEKADTIRYHLEKALYLMREGRPGPVWLDIPVDVQAAEINPSSQIGFYSKSKKCLNFSQRVSVKNAIKGLLVASRPLVILGQGVRIAGAAKYVKEFIEKLSVPFQTSWNGMDLISTNHRLCFGRANVFAPRYANLIIQNADYVLFIGCRLGIQHTGYNVEGFVRGAHVVMVDVDENEMDKPGLNIDEKLVMSADDFIKGALGCIDDMRRSDISSWIRKCDNLKVKFPIAPKLSEIADSQYVDPFYFVDTLSDLMPDNALFPFGSSGMGHTVTGGIFRTKDGQRVFTFKGLASMGYGLPCAVGAGIAYPDRPVYTLVGEGGLQLNIQELQTAKTHDLKLKVIVFNNGGYHSIHMTQTGYFNKHFVGSGPESDTEFPPLEKVANLYDMKYFKVKNNVDVVSSLSHFIEYNGAAFLEVFLDPFKGLEPKLASYKLTDGTMVSRPLEDMLPLLDRNELKSIMEIPLFLGDNGGGYSSLRNIWEAA